MIRTFRSAAASAPLSGFDPNLFFLPNNNQTGTAGGVIGGAQVGYNFQFNPSIVIGAEADFQGSSISGNGQRTTSASIRRPSSAPPLAP